MHLCSSSLILTVRIYMEIKANKFKDVLLNIADTIEDKVEYLTELDARIGDGDHGINMAKGFKKIKADLIDYKGNDIGFAGP